MSNNKALIAAILVMIGIYLLVSFAIWDLNPKHWTIVSRTMFACFSPVFSLIAYVATKIDQGK